MVAITVQLNVCKATKVFDQKKKIHNAAKYLYFIKLSILNTNHQTALKTDKKHKQTPHSYKYTYCVNFTIP